MKIVYSFILCIQLICFYKYSSGEDIEYYPSQNYINSISTENKIIKHGIDKQDRAKREISWRFFNETEKHLKRDVDPVFHGHPKTREEIWNEKFLNKSIAFDQNPSLIVLLHNITTKYMNECSPIILYDAIIASEEPMLFKSLFEDFPVTFVHGKIDKGDNIINPDILNPVHECIHIILLVTDIKSTSKVIGMQSKSKVVIVSKTSQWAVQEFLIGPMSRKIVNLLVIGQSFKDGDDSLEAPYILYTHKLYVDGLGASKPVVLTSWIHNRFSREVNLFPKKLTKGYAGHRFIISAANKPPFVIRRIVTDMDGGNPRVSWDGVEIRMLRLLAERNNFSLEIKEPQALHLGPGDAVTKELSTGRADVGAAGLYITQERIQSMDMSFSHSQDCAVFITLLSTALPRYRAILGPFHWHVWVALTFTYLIGIFPLAFSDKHSLRHLIHNSGEIENMFWYVFGTFTNCFTFVGKNSWSKTTKITTRLLIGWYWIFTIIITSCYTGSIIAFVTLPIFPETIDSIDQLLRGFFRLGTLDRGGWERWFFNSSDPATNKLLKKLELVSDVESGIRNTTKSFFWNYAFLGSRAELEFIVQSNFSMTKKSKKLHISNECFVPFGVSISFPNQSLYTEKLSSDIHRMSQSGLISKLVDEVKWDMQRSTSGHYLAAGPGTHKVTSVDDKGLSLEDTQGMFLLLAAGAIIAGAALISEWMGGCTRKCRLTKKTKDEKPSSAGSRQELIPTPASHVGSEIKIIADDCESRDFSAESRDTLEGELIHVSDESIMIHRNMEASDWGSRRSSSADLDREVREIFEQDLKRRRRVQSGSAVDVKDSKREPTASKGAFGDHVSIS